jgi:hypothetical protein
MKLFIATALATLIAGQAVALSCMRPDPVGSFARFAEDDASYTCFMASWVLMRRYSRRVL